MEFTNIFQLKDPKPKNKGQTNFYECCDLMKKVYLAVHTYIETRRRRSERKMELSSSSRVAQTIDEGDRNACSLLQIQFPFILDLSKEKESSSEK